MASRQDKATTDRHAKILRELVKRPANKSCADCRRNDARWASWNLGCFVCIRCSGIHRSMGTHISKVKSIDLDIWTPEQMEHVQKWGNERANKYWEAHLKPGHVVAEHKIESFIRSKYESRRWAMSIPIPTDPSVLDGDDSAIESAPAPLPAVNTFDNAAAATPQAPQVQQQRSSVGHPLLSSSFKAPPPTNTATRPPQAHVTAIPQPTPAPAAPTPGSSIFDLDFHSPSPALGASAAAPKNQKDDIMSLFSMKPPAPAPAPSISSPTGGGYNAWGAPAPAATAPLQQQSHDVWGSSAPVQQPVMSNDIWGSTAPAPAPSNPGLDIFNTSSVWGSTPSIPAQQQKKNDIDAFSDIWK